MSQTGGDGRAGAPTVGELLSLIRSDGPLTRARLLELTRLSRPALSRHLEALLAEGLVVERPGRSTGGRPPAELAFDPSGGVVLAGWLGRTRSGLAVADLAGGILGVRVLEGDLDPDPGIVLALVEAAFDELLAGTGHDRSSVLGIGVGVPWPLDAMPRRGDVPGLSSWDGSLLERHLEERFAVPAVVDRDANLAALAEHRMNWQHVTADIVYVKAGARIGCGIVSGGLVQRGAHGSAGEIGHVWVSSADGRPCPCGNSGCLDTVASGFSLAERLGWDGGGSVGGGRHVVRLALDGDTEAVRLLRDAGRATGEAVAAAVNLLNPAIIIIGGDLAGADEFLAGVREAVYQRATAHATQALRITRSQLGERAGLIGPALAVLDVVLAPAAVDAAMSTERVPA